MAKQYLRKIVVDGETYLWYRGHWHPEVYERSPCVEKLTVFSRDFKKSPLRIYFKEDDNVGRVAEANWWEVGYPENGVLWLSDQNRNCILKINLNRPKVIAAFIRLACTTGWTPLVSKSPFIIENGLSLLDEHRKTLREGIDPIGNEMPQDQKYFSVQTGGIYLEEGRYRLS